MSNTFYLDILRPHNDVEKQLPLPVDRQYSATNQIFYDSIKGCFSFDMNMDIEEQEAFACSYIFLFKLTNGLEQELSLAWNHTPFKISFDPHVSFNQLTQHVKNLLLTKEFEHTENFPIHDLIMSIKFEHRLCTINGSVNMFDQPSINKIGQRFQLLFEQLFATKEPIFNRIFQPLFNLSILLPQERQLLLSLTSCEMDQNRFQKNLHQQFARMAHFHPQKIAIILDEQLLTYGEMLVYVQRVALSLMIDYKIQLGQIICQYMDRSIEMIIGIFGIVMAGAIYCPILSTDPLSRVMTLIEQTKATHILIHSCTSDRFNGIIPLSSTLIDVVTCLNVSYDNTNFFDQFFIDPNHVAIVIFTSGSTGQPKGVQLSHKNMFHLFTSLKLVHIIDMNATILQLAQTSFDVHIKEIFLALAYSGGSLIMLHPHGHLDLDYVSNTIEQNQVSFIVTIPRYVYTLCEYIMSDNQKQRLRSLRTILNGGEPVLVSHASTMLDFFKDQNVCLYHAYGPAEASIVTTYHCLTSTDLNRSQISCGKRLPNVKIQLRDEYMQLVGIGQIGELFIGGMGVFCGYLMRPDLTQKALIQLDNENVDFYYRTGDTFRLDEAGQLYFVGRRDYQVKLRGQRIELGEIENVLLTSSFNVSACIAVKVVHDELDYLVAYVQTGNKHIMESCLIDECRRRLPRFMIPTRIVILSEFPYNANGKINRRCLPPVDICSIENKDDVIRRTDLEERVHRIWCNTLHIFKRSIPLDASFFSLGGTSLVFMKILYKYHAEFAVDIDIPLFFEYATIGNHATFLSKSGASSDLWQRLPVNEGPASYAQERIYLDERVRFDIDGVDASAYHDITLYRISSGSINRERLRKTLAIILQAHAALRTSFHLSDNGLQQRIEPLTECDYITTIYSSAQDLKSIERDEIINKSLFDLSKGRLMRCHVCLWYENHCTTDYETLFPADVIILNFHHITVDGETNGIFNEDLRTAFSQGTLSLEPDALRYLDYSIHERHLDMTAASKFWSNMLQGYDLEQSLPLPYDRRRTGNNRSGAQVNVVRFEFGPSLSRAFLTYASRANVSVFQLGLACFYAFLARLTAGTADVDLCLACYSANRYRPELQRIAGLFVTTLPYRLQFNLNESFDQLVQHIRNLTVKIFKYSYFPLQRLLEKKNDRHGSQFFETTFDINMANQNIELDGALIEMKPFPIDEMAKFDLFVRLLYAPKEEASLVCSFDSALDVFDKSTIDTMIARFHYLLNNLFLSDESKQSRKLNQLSLLLADEYKLVRDLDNYGKMFSGYGRRPFVQLHAAFFYAAQDHSQKVAIVLDEQTLSYGELSSIISSQVNYFRQVVGVKSGDIICQCVERSIEMVVGIMVILTCGAIYCPLNPYDPIKRLHDLLNQTNTNSKRKSRCVIVNTEKTRDKFKVDYQHLIQTINLLPFDDNMNDTIAASSMDDCAVVLFTSGSTGQPKGVQLTHENVSMSIWSYEFANVIISGDVVLQMTPCSFDMHIIEILGALILNSSLVMLHPNGNYDLDYLSNTIAINQVTLLHSVPSHLDVLCRYLEKNSENGFDRLLTVRSLCTSGEAMNTRCISTYLKNLAPQSRAFNIYGPCECTNVTVHTMDRLTLIEGTCIGDIMPHLSCRILDDNMQPVIPGTMGMLYVSGSSVFPGYLNRSDLTIPVLHKHENQHIYFKTGDWVKLDRKYSRRLHYVGRQDFMIKLRGQRIELGEIERTIIESDLSLIEKAVVMKCEQNEQQYLVAYVQVSSVPCQKYKQLEKKIMLYARQHLASYMLPNRIIFMQELPLNSNGKIDRLKLPIIDFSDNQSIISFEANEEPTNSIEQTMHDIWCQMLNRTTISVTENLFTLGGTSLLLMRLYSQYQKYFNIQRISISTLFVQPTIREHAQLVDFNGSLMCQWQSLSIVEARASFNQENVWVTDQSWIFRSSDGQRISLYRIPVCYHVRNGRLSLEKLYASLDTIIDRHSIFRTALYFDHINDCVKQMIMTSNENLRQHYSLVTSTVQNDDEIERILKDEQTNISHFDLNRARSMRVHLIECNDGKQILLFNFHHCMFDGHSIDLFMREFTQAYRHINGIDHCLSSLSQLNYIDYALHERTMDMTQANQFWQAELTNYPFDKRLALCYDNKRLPVRTLSPGPGILHNFKLTQETSEAIVIYAQEHNTTLYLLGLTCFYLFLYLITDDDDICVEILLSNRYRDELQSILGLFSNNMPCRVRFDHCITLTFKQLLDEVNQCFLRVMQYGYFPYSELTELHRRNASCPHYTSPFLNALFVLTTSSNDDKLILDDSGPQLIAMPTVSENWTLEELEIDMNFDESSRSITFSVTHSTDLFLQATGKLIGQRFKLLLEHLFHPNSGMIHDQELFDKVNLLLEHEQAIIDRFSNPHINTTLSQLTRSSTTMSLFQKMSLVMAEQSLSFAELFYHVKPSFEIDNILSTSRLGILLQMLAKNVKNLEFIDQTHCLKTFENDVILLQLPLEFAHQFLLSVIFGGTLLFEPIKQDETNITCLVTRTGQQWRGGMIPNVRRYCWLSGGGSSVLRMRTIKMSHLPSSNCLLYHLYTTVEATSILSVHQIVLNDEQDDNNIISIGNQLSANFTILDSRGQPVWTKKLGQLHIGRVPTGDLLIYDMDKKIFYLGSIYDQLKLDNRRLDIHHIVETILDAGAHLGVIDCLLIKLNNLLAAHLLVSHVNNNKQDEFLYTIWSYCHYHLENAFVPGAWSILQADEWPLNKYGCIDRLRLPHPNDMIRKIPPPSSRPLIPLEQQLRSVFAQVLRFSNENEVNIYASFFEHMGGCSLLLLQAVAIIRDHIYSRMDVCLFVENPSVITLAQAIQAQTA